MAYEKTNWVNDETPLNAENMNKIEQGIADSASQEDFDNLVNNVTQIEGDKNSIKLGGASATNAGESCVVIGKKASVSGNYGVAIGRSSKSSGTATAIGAYAIANNSDSIAIGSGLGTSFNSKANANYAVQIGQGTNSTQHSLQIEDDNIYKTDTHTLTVQNAEINGTPAYGVLSGTSAPTTTTVGAVGQFYLDTTNKQLYQCMSITQESVDEVDTNVYEWTNLSESGVSQEDFDKLVNNEVQIQKSGGGFIAGGLADAGSSSVAIGYQAKATFYAGQVAIGSYTSAYAAGSVAIGNGAKTTKNEAIQLGSGTNNTANSLQIYDDNIYNADTHTLTVNNIEQNGNPVYAVLQGTTAPDTTTIGAVTQFYLNTTDKKLYQCKSITTSETDSTSTYEWQEVGGSSEKKYMHTLTIGGNGQYQFALFSVITSDSETYTTADEVAQALYDLGYTNIDNKIEATGFNAWNNSIVVGVYSSDGNSTAMVYSNINVEDTTSITIDNVDYEFCNTIGMTSRSSNVFPINDIKDTVVEL